MDENAMRLLIGSLAQPFFGQYDHYLIRHNDTKLEDLEEYKESRRRYRGKMTTGNLDSFVEYVERFEPNLAACFVDQDDMCAMAYLDIGTGKAPGHCDNLACLELDQTAIYKSILGLCDRDQDQRAFISWIEDWREDVLFFNDGMEEIDTGKAVAGFRSIKTMKMAEAVHTKDHNRDGLSVIESVDMDSGMSVPRYMDIVCCPYVGIDNMSITVKITVLADDKKPVLSFRIVKKELLAELITAEFIRKIRARLEMPVYIGRFMP